MFVRMASERNIEMPKALLAKTRHVAYDAIYGVGRVNEIAAEWHFLAAFKARLNRRDSEFFFAEDRKKIPSMAFAAAIAMRRLLCFSSYMSGLKIRV